MSLLRQAVSLFSQGVRIVALSVSLVCICGGAAKAERGGGKYDLAYPFFRVSEGDKSGFSNSAEKVAELNLAPQPRENLAIGKILFLFWFDVHQDIGNIELKRLVWSYDDLHGETVHKPVLRYLRHFRRDGEIVSNSSDKSGSASVVGENKMHRVDVGPFQPGSLRLGSLISAFVGIGLGLPMTIVGARIGRWLGAILMLCGLAAGLSSTVGLLFGLDPWSLLERAV